MTTSSPRSIGNLYPPLLAGLAGFALGALLFAVLPASWLFVAPVAHDHGPVRAALRWACPMLCTIMPGPGICPVCGMDLELLDTSLRLTAHDQRMIDLRETRVEKRVLHRSLRTFGRLELNEAELRTVTAWSEGRVMRRFADTTFTDVAEGEPVIALYSPELYAAQTEFVSTLRMYDHGLIESSRERLSLLGLTVAQVRELEQTQTPSMVVEIGAPATGKIIALQAKEGEWLRLGDPIYSLASFDPLWLRFDVYEQELAWFKAGQSVELSVAAWPGNVFPGRIDLIEEEVDVRTRTIKVRVVVDNSDGRLKPGMFATVTSHAALGPDGGVAESDEPEPVVAIPRSAVLDTGIRQVVFVKAESGEHHEHHGHGEHEHHGHGEHEHHEHHEHAEGHEHHEHAEGHEHGGVEFRLREVRLGPYADEWVMVVAGLDEGEIIVTRGAMLIDSQLQLLGHPSLLEPEGAADPIDPHQDH